MIDWAAPAWLAGLALLPALWWLHRQASRGRSLYVASLALWRTAPDPARAGAAQRRAALDPAFWRRALLVTALILAVAGPRWPVGGPEVVVWIDDGLSLRTREPGGTRLALGLAAAARALGERHATGATLRSLADPAWSRRWAAPYRTDATDGDLPLGAARPPAAATLAAGVEHWLLTDGAHEPVNSWRASAPLARVIQIGAATENAAVVRLAARPALDGGEQWTVDVEVANLGRAEARRTLVLRRGETVLLSTELRLAAGGTASRRVALAASPADVAQELRIVAVLAPADALAADDTLALELPARAKVQVGVDARCGAPLQRAIRAHPGLAQAVSAGTPALWIDCGGPGPAAPAARLRIRRGATSAPLDDTPAWRDASGTRAGLPVPAAALRAADATLVARPGDRVLLAAGVAPLVLRRAGVVPELETRLDLDDPALAALPTYPLLVAALVERALGAELAAGRLAARDAQDSRIAPRAALPVGNAPAPLAAAALEAAPMLLGLAFLLAALEALAAARALARLGRHYRSAAP